MKNLLQKGVTLYNKLEEYFLIYSMMIMVLIVFIQVIFRYIFNNSLSWSEELVRYLFMWQVWLGASLGMRINEHIRVDMFVKKLPEIGQQFLNIIVTLLILLFYLFLIRYGFLYLKDVITKNMTSTALQLPLAAVYASLPCGSIVIALRYIGVFCRQIKSLTTPAETGKKEGRTRL